RRRHTRSKRDWSSDVCSSDLAEDLAPASGRGSQIHDGQTGAQKLVLVAKLDQLERRPRTIATPLRFDDVGIGDVLMHPRLAEARSEERRVGKECRSRWAAYR